MGIAVRTAIAQFRAAEQRQAAPAPPVSDLELIARGLAGDPAARAKLAELLAELRGRLELLEAGAGAVARVTEAGEARITEAGEARILEP